MFYNLATIVKVEDFPDTTQAWRDSTLNIYPEKARSTSTISSRLIFPPFDFTFRHTLDMFGSIECWDSLDETDTLYCAPYTFDGNYLPFEPESFALAWAFLLNTKNRVICRPGYRGLFVATYRDQLNRILKMAEVLILEDVQDRLCYKKIGEVLFSNGTNINLNYDTEHNFNGLDEILSDVAGLLPMDVIHIEFYIDEDKKINSFVSPYVPRDVFIRNRDKILECFGQ